MQIDVDGRTWTVEQREASTLVAETGRRFCALRFRPEDAEGDEGVEMKWVPRPRRLTPHMAERLFHLAGERRWTDPRDGTRYQVVLESGPWPGDEGPAEIPSVMVRFVSPEGSVATAYEVDRPLGLATPDELAAHLDRAAGKSEGATASLAAAD